MAIEPDREGFGDQMDVSATTVVFQRNTIVLQNPFKSGILAYVQYAESTRQTTTQEASQPSSFVPSTGEYN